MNSNSNLITGTSAASPPPANSKKKNDTHDICDQHLYDNFELRAPLQPENCGWITNKNDSLSNTATTEVSSASKQPRQSRSPQQNPYKFLRPLVCRMFVASRVLKLGNEALFTAVILLYRYAAAYYAQHDSPSPSLDKTSIATQPQREQPSSKRRRNAINQNAAVTKNCSIKQKRSGNEDKDIDETDHWKWVAAACLVLACKAEEETRRLRDVINLAHMLNFGRDQKKKKEKNPVSNGSKTAFNGDNLPNRDKKEGIPKSPPPRRPLSPPPKSSSIKFKLDITTNVPELDAGYWDSKERIVATEQAVLRMIQFDVKVSRPHRLAYILIEDVSSDQLRLLHIAWRRINDALFYPSALCHPVLPLACAAVCLAIEEEEKASQQQIHKDDSHTMQKKPKPCFDGNITGVMKNLGLDQYWLDSYKVTPDALTAAKKSLVEATNSL
mmetsp:Transcript_1739/g.2408  ORF Transcript_1739/g.2408 Transcript_1739/m.2408 type:complete len:441 (-) Transcript_1739:55-1377(-)